MSDSYEFLTAHNIPSYLASHTEISSIIDHTAITEVK